MRKAVRLVATHSSGSRRVYEKIYDGAVLQALAVIWEAFNCQCGKLLAPFLHANIDSIAAEPKFAVPETVCQKLGRTSTPIDLMNEMALMNKAIDKLIAFADPVPEFVSKRSLKPLLFGSYGLIF